MTMTMEMQGRQYVMAGQISVRDIQAGGFGLMLDHAHRVAMRFMTENGITSQPELLIQYSPRHNYFEVWLEVPRFDHSYYAASRPFFADGLKAVAPQVERSVKAVMEQAVKVTKAEPPPAFAAREIELDPQLQLPKG